MSMMPIVQFIRIKRYLLVLHKRWKGSRIEIDLINNLVHLSHHRFRLFDSENVTCDKDHMWLCPFNRQEKVRLMITLSVSKKLHGLRIWNYNASPEDSYRGVNLS